MIDINVMLQYVLLLLCPRQTWRIQITPISQPHSPQPNVQQNFGELVEQSSYVVCHALVLYVSQYYKLQL